MQSKIVIAGATRASESTRSSPHFIVFAYVIKVKVENFNPLVALFIIIEKVSTKVSTTFEILMAVLSNYIVQIMYLPIVKFFNLHNFN